MKNLHLAAIALLMLILSGCASGYPVTLDSNPQGATVICEGLGNIGYTPTTLFYSKEAVNSWINSGGLSFQTCSANWASGAKAIYPQEIPAQQLVQQFPDGVRATVQRPNTPGLAQDNQFALQVQQMQMQQAALEQQTAAMQAQAAAAQQQAASALTQALTANRPRTCFTNYGMTTCY
jgi:outer membrane murein-binding lipoprotein Lpp